LGGRGGRRRSAAFVRARGSMQLEPHVGVLLRYPSGPLIKKSLVL
jgi:hypothetical protein